MGEVIKMREERTLFAIAKAKRGRIKNESVK